MNRKSFKTLLMMIFALTISGVFLYFSLQDVNLGDLLQAMSSVNGFSLVVSVIFLVGSVLLRSLRWLLIADTSWTEYISFYRSTITGVFANLVFPLRAGEFVRVVMLTRLAPISLPVSIASSFVDRFIDMFVLLICAVIIYIILPVSEFIGQWVIILLLTLVLLVSFMLFNAYSSGKIEGILHRIFLHWLQHWQASTKSFLADLRLEFRLIISGRLSLSLLLIMALILLFDYAAITFLLYSYGLKLPYIAPLILWVFMAAGSTLPSSPGYIGVYQFASVWALSLFGISASLAVVIATTLQINTLIIAILMAGPGVWRICRDALSEKVVLKGKLNNGS
jgi:glycosyltransferase 2 family protein